MYLILFLSITLSQNFLYKSIDWDIISNPGSVYSISSSYNEIYFCSENGIYIYDIDTSSLLFDQEYMTKFNFSESKLIHYDEHTDYIWYLNENSLNYKPRISTFWREINFNELNISSHRMIKNIGSDYRYVYLDVGHSILLLNPISGNLEIQNDNHDYDLVKWSSSNKSEFNKSVDLTNYFSFEGYQLVSNDKIELNGKIIYINCIYKDKFHDYWLGTNTGEIFHCDSKMKSIKKLNSIPLIQDFNITYLDQYNEWWFSTNNYIYINENPISNYPIFISHWNESENIWMNYTKNKYSSIESKDITCIKRVDNWLYIGTKKGLLIFDIYNNEWLLYNKDNGMKSDIIYDINYANNNIYIATNGGISVITTLGNILINQDIFTVFDSSRVFKLNTENDKIIISSELGIFKYNYLVNNLDILVNEKYLDAFHIDDNHMIGVRNNRIYSLSDKKELLYHLDKIKNVCLCNDHLWINNQNKAVILNLKNRNIFEYNNNDGIMGSKINDLGCDDEWVWFSTNKGLSFYNWSKYHYNEK